MFVSYAPSEAALWLPPQALTRRPGYGNPPPVAGPILGRTKTMKLQRRNLKIGMVRAIAFLERPRQAAWLRVRASEFRERAAILRSASRQEFLDLAARFEELAVDVQRLEP
jgi:hypothetical protein